MPLNCELTDLQENLLNLTKNTQSDNNKTVSKNNVVTPKSVTSLNRSQLSMRESLFIIETITEGLGHYTDEYSISKSIIQSSYGQAKERADAIKV